MAVTSSVPGANAATTNQMATGSGATSGRWRVIGAVGQAPERAGTNGHFELSVRDGIITSLQPAGSGRPRPAVGQARLVLAPLLVNAHDHGRGFGNVLAGIPDAPLETWIASLASQMGTTTQEALVGDGCRVMLRSGVGATVICVNPLGRDTAAEVRAAAKAATEAGPEPPSSTPSPTPSASLWAGTAISSAGAAASCTAISRPSKRSRRRSRTRLSRCNSAPWAPVGQRGHPRHRGRARPPYGPKSPHAPSRVAGAAGVGR